MHKNTNILVKSGRHLLRKGLVLQDQGRLSDVDLRSSAVLPAAHHEQFSDGSAERVLQSRAATPETVRQELHLGTAEKSARSAQPCVRLAGGWSSVKCC